MTKVDALLGALAEPRRRRILALVQGQELSAGEIAKRFKDVTQPAISQHLKVLKEAGLIVMRKDRNYRLYRGRPDGLSEVRSYLEGFWDNSLSQLKAAAEAEKKK